jgi:HEAT repeat protein
VLKDSLPADTTDALKPTVAKPPPNGAGLALVQGCKPALMPEHRTTDRTRVRFLKAVAVIGLVAVAISVAHDRLTAESRFYAKLDAELWKLRQPAVDRVALSASKRAHYHALLRCADPASRWQAAADLARWRDRDSVPALIAALQDDEGTQKTCRIAQSLGELGDAMAVPALLQAIHHPRNLDLRVCATHALAEIGDARAVTPLIAKAENLDLREDDRVSAILVLGDLARPEAVPALHRIIRKEPDQRFRTIAAAAMRQIELMQCDDPVNPLAEALNSPSNWIHRRWFIEKLGERWDSRVAEALNRFLRRPDGWTSDRIQATALLLHRRSLDADLLRELAASSLKEDRWLAQYAQACGTDQHTAEMLVQSELINGATASTISP